MILSICIPNYNRLNCLDNCLNSILIASKNVKDFDFEVCISDNNSITNPIEIIEKYKKYYKIIYNRNDENLGFALNAIKTVSVSTGKYAWLIGNDDLILPNTLIELKKIFKENSDTEFFFINSYYLNSKFLEKFPYPFNTSNLEASKMKKLSRFKQNKRVNFWEIIDPDVSWEFLIGIFLSIFNREMWLEGLDCLNKKDLEDKNIWSNFDNTCLNAKVVSTVFKDKKSFICSQPLSVNLIGEREWVNLYDFIEIVRIPELIDYYRSQGMGFFKYIYCKNFALRNFFNFFTKIMIHGDKAGRNYVNFYNHFLKNLIYPYAWLSIIFFVMRAIRKMIKY
ncbi:glycosyltransferase [Candidatus Pelagibacter sp.]|nr:glycosyltransferase [Candidatus Pelagibacter sp.]